jgi:hypothetical protein
MHGAVLFFDQRAFEAELKKQQGNLARDVYKTVAVDWEPKVPPSPPFSLRVQCGVRFNPTRTTALQPSSASI